MGISSPDNEVTGNPPSADDKANPTNDTEPAGWPTEDGPSGIG